MKNLLIVGLIILSACSNPTSTPNSNSDSTDVKESGKKQKSESISENDLIGTYYGKGKDFLFESIELREGGKCLLYFGDKDLLNLTSVSDYERKGKYLYVKYQFLDLHSQASFEILSNKKIRCEQNNDVYVKRD